MTPVEIEERFEEAARTLRRLPDNKPQGYFNTWPPIARTMWEIMAMERQPMKIWATPQSISRMEECFDWMLWLDGEDARIVWMRAEKASFRTISRRLGLSRMTAWRRWVGALILIANRLETSRRDTAKSKARSGGAANGARTPLGDRQ
jgi:hypothetical protein